MYYILGECQNITNKLNVRYIIYDPNIFPMLDGFRRSGRKVFLLTNSLWDYTQARMESCS